MNPSAVRKLYIAYSLAHSKEPVSVILAPSREHAEVYWQGLGIQASRVEEIDPNDTSASPYAVVSVVGIRNVRLMDLRDRRPGLHDHLHVMVRGRGEEPR